MVPLGFLLGTLAAFATLLTLGLERFTHSIHGRDLDGAVLTQLWGVISDAHALASIATLAPAVLVIIIGEIARIRSALYYVAGGGLAMAALPLLQRTASVPGGLAQVGLVWQVFATAGFVGGIVYWLIAGRHA